MSLADRLIIDLTNIFNLFSGSDESVQVRLPEKINVLKITMEIWVWILAVFLTFVVTLACFPTITALVQSKSVNKI